MSPVTADMLSQSQSVTTQVNVLVGQCVMKLVLNVKRLSALNAQHLIAYDKSAQVTYCLQRRPCPPLGDPSWSSSTINS